MHKGFLWLNTFLLSWKIKINTSLNDRAKTLASSFANNEQNERYLNPLELLESTILLPNA